MSNKKSPLHELSDYQIAIINHTSAASEADELTTAINKREYLVFNEDKWASEHPGLDARESMLEVLDNAKVIIILWDEKCQNDHRCGELFKYVRENRLTDTKGGGVSVDMVSCVMIGSFDEDADFGNKDEYTFYKKQYGMIKIEIFGSPAWINLLLENIERRAKIKKTFNLASQYNMESNQLVALAAQETEYGSDRLGIANDAIALARLIAIKDLIPPFTVGLLGGWGSGKSFTFNLIEQEIINVQHKYLQDKKESYEYAGHIYVVRFDAWTFSKGDIWSSLMYSILTQLNEQVQVEEMLKKKNGNEEYSLLDEHRKLRKNEIEYLKQHGIEKLDRDAISKPLAAIVEEEYKDLKKELEKKRTELKSKESNLKGIDKGISNLQEEKEQRKETHKAIQIANNEVDETYRKVEIVYGREVKNLISEHFSKVKEDVIEHSEETGLLSEELIFEPLETLVNSTKTLWTVFKHGNFTIFKMFLIVLSIAVPAIMIHLRGKIDDVLLAIISASTPAFSVIGRFVMKYNQIITPLTEEFHRIKELKEKIAKESKDQSTQNFEDEIEAKTIQRQELLTEIEEQKNDIDAKEKQQRLVQGKNLKEFLEGKDVSGYESNLNVVHQAKKDLDLLSNALLNQRNREQFPRGKARIVLFIDDLDRCNDKMVVETLEALKLLVRTEVFVVVVAIDMQYVTLALENNYKGILRRGTHPSGLDYLEKIIQLPYRISPMYSRDAIYSYVTSLTRTNKEEKKGDTNHIEKKSEYTVNVQENRRNLLPKKADTTVGVQENEVHESKVIEENEVSQENPQSSILSQIEINENEEKMLIRIFIEVRVSPRAVKRLINVLKIMKIVCNKDVMSNDGMLEALLLIFALSASLNPKIRTAMCDVFARFEKAYTEKDYYGGGTTFFEILFGKELDNKYLEKEHTLSLSKLKKIKVNINNYAIVVHSIHKVRCFSFVGESLNYDSVDFENRTNQEDDCVMNDKNLTAGNRAVHVEEDDVKKTDDVRKIV